MPSRVGFYPSLNKMVDYSTGEVLQPVLVGLTGEVLQPVLVGLSTYHKRPQEKSLSLPERAFGLICDRVPGFAETQRPKPAKITGWLGGSLIKVSGGGYHRSKVFKPSSVTLIKGDKVSLGFSGVVDVPEDQPGKRGVITGFSSASRRRLQRKLAMVDKSYKPLFVTITYPDEFPVTFEEWARHLSMLRKRLKRRGFGFIWKKELKKRLSGVNAGKVAPHFHAFVWGSDYEFMRSWLPGAWFDIVGSGDEKHLRAGVRVEQIRDLARSAKYIYKYVSKSEEEEYKSDYASIGRCWGVANSEFIPWAVAVSIEIGSARDYNDLVRYMRRYARCKGYGYMPSYTILCNDPYQWLSMGERMVSDG